jgi:hypothetical protein
LQLKDVRLQLEKGNRRQTHFVNHFSLLVGLFFALSIVLPIIFRFFRSGPREARVVIEYAQKRGYALVNPALAQALDKSYLEMLKDSALTNANKASSDIDDIEKLDGGTGGWLAFTCNLGSKEVTIFNLSVTSPTDTQGGIRYKVAKIKAAGLPRFSLGRNSGLHTFENVVDKIAGSSKPPINLDTRQYPKFSTHFWIRGSDPAAVTAFLSDAKIKFLKAAKLKGTLATNANYLVYFEDGVLLTEQDFDSFIARAEAIGANLL